MFRVELQVKNFDKIRLLYRNFPKASLTLSESVREKIAKRLVFELRRAIAEKKSIVTWSLYKDIYYTVEEKKTVVHFGSDRTKYASAVDLGTKPHMPPIPKILFFVQRKGIEPRAAYIARLRSKRARDRRLAGAIAMSIAKKGTRGKYITRIALRRAHSKIDRIIREEIDRICSIYGL